MIKEKGFYFPEKLWGGLMKKEWQRKLTDISFYPQNIDKEGTPNKKSKTLF